jgi:small subunit ribosomal protein S6
MTVAATRKYKATIILDTRGREETAEQLIEEVKNEISAQGIEVVGEENLGRKDFARQPDPKIGAGNYVQLILSGPPETAAKLQEHFRLNKLVFRLLIQSA